jgi:sigma-B regulation protein RsbU (phosphoserine phosphatase)
MALLVISDAQGKRRTYDMEEAEAVIGRASNAAITLEGANVSRRHARILREGADLAIEDLGSSNGTYLNGARLHGIAPLLPQDCLRIGNYTLRLENAAAPQFAAPGDLAIQRQTLATAANQELYRENAAQKLQAVLELAHALGNTLDLDTLLNQFLDQVLKLFPKADRALVIFLENEEPFVRVLRDRRPGARGHDKLFSRSLIRQVVDSGMAALADDVKAMDANLTLNAMGVRSVLCIPLRAHESPVFGVAQLDRFQAGQSFSAEDLHLLTAVTLQISMVLDKARLHQMLLEQERIGRELALAREIQQAFLPAGIPDLGLGFLDLAADLQPAKEISGDFYDFIPLDDSRIALAVADVSGKGMPAALFMSMVRALLRQTAKNSRSPAEMLMALNKALAPDNPKFMFVTALLGIYDARTGEFVFARGGHPAPLLRSADGTIREIDSHPGCLIGIEENCPSMRDSTIQLQHGDTILFYTDGVTEAAEPQGAQFGCERLLDAIRQASGHAPLTEWIQQLKLRLAEFCGATGPQDDVTLLLLRHADRGAR